MAGFTVVWLGQVCSLIGTNMTGFAFTIWAYQVTGSATALALMGVFIWLPGILIGPLAGALVDRWNRKLVMMLSDLGAGLATVVVFLLHTAGALEIWHLYAAGAFAGAFQAFQWPAYSAAISTMLPKEQYGRANGMISLAESGSLILAPILAGVLLGRIGLAGILSLDIISFLLALGALTAVHIPQPAATVEGQVGQGSLWQESLYGFRYILQRPSLLGLQLVFLTLNFTGSVSMGVMNAMILARTASDAAALGTVLSIGAVGGVLGGLLMSTWGGPRRRVHGVLLGLAAHSVIGTMAVGLGRSVAVWAAGSLAGSLLITILNGSNQAIWQAKVAPDVQGRVFAARRLIAQVAGPVGMLLAGPLADKVMEPAMMEGGRLASLFGGLVGTGPGAGMGLMLVLAGLAGLICALWGYAIPAIRNAEDLLPDHGAQARPVQETTA